jgi:ribosomal-protein-alanine N-acetyltransferase
MNNISQIAIIPFERRYRRDILHMIQTDERLHIHLDWNTVDEWIGEPDVLLYMAWQDRHLLGAIAVSPPLDGCSWVRLFALSDTADGESVMQALWEPFKEYIASKGVLEVAVLILRPWVTSYIQQLGFRRHDSIITLRREGTKIPKPLRTDVKVRGADMRELPRVVEVDHGAFRPIWQLSAVSLRQAVRMAASFRVAELDHKVVAYQLSTMYRDGAHLARLATLPELQGTGIGGLLVGDLVDQLCKRNVDSLTVNTNETNMQSLNLYRRYGFALTGMNMDVWTLSI